MRRRRPRPTSGRKKKETLSQKRWRLQRQVDRLERYDDGDTWGRSLAGSFGNLIKLGLWVAVGIVMLIVLVEFLGR